MTETNQTHEGPRVSQEQMRDLNRIRRSRSDRRIAGVAGGLGRHFDVDPTVLRVVFVVLTFFGGAGLLMYAAVWLFVPEDGEDRAPLEVGTETRKVVLIGALVVGVCLMLGGAWGGFHGGWVLGVLAVIAAVVLLGRDRNQQASRPVPPPASGADVPVGSTMTDDAPPAWMPPRRMGYVPPSRPPKTGIIWFWPTLAMVAIGLGTLGIVDNSHSISSSAYPVLALTITGVMLLVGAFVGRAGGLILLGVLSLMGLGVTAAVGDGFDTSNHRIEVAPTTAADVKPEYTTSNGSIRLDLSGVTDPAALDGRSIDVSLNAGDVEVIVPRGVNVDVDAEIRFAGDIDLTGEKRRDGFHPQVETLLHSGVAAPAGTTTPTIDLELDARVGEITVRHP